MAVTKPMKLGGADAGEERVDLGAQALRGAAELGRGAEHLLGGLAGHAGALAHALDVGGDGERAARRLLGVARDLLGRRALLLDRRGDLGGDPVYFRDGSLAALDRGDRALGGVLN